jgi:flavin-dependent dehydrogenase
MQVLTARSGFALRYADGDGCRAALGIDRPTLDAILLDHARQCRAAVQEESHVLGALVESGQVVGVRARTRGGEREYRCRFVVAADGLHSAVARSLRLEARAWAPQRLGLVARYAGVHGIASTGEMHVGRGFYCGLAPVGAGLVNVGLVVPLDEKPRSEPIASFFERWLGRLPRVADRLATASRLTAIHGVGPLARRVHRAAGRGYLLVGDAAGFLDPFTGEGVYRALRGAELAAEGVDEALAARERMPRSYERARRREFGAKESVCQLIQFFLRHESLFETVVGHAAARPSLAGRLGGILGDYAPAGPALRPAFLWSLLRP